MVRLLNGPWRNTLAEMVSNASRSILLAAPFIKQQEADWLCDLIPESVEVTTLANIDPDAVSSSALDMEALERLAEASASAELFALSSLHAKVFVADNDAAIVTSGNLTSAGLDRNREYGVLIERAALVRSVRKDFQALTTLGSRVDGTTLGELKALEDGLREAKAASISDETRRARRNFADVLRDAKPTFAQAQVGDRSAHAVFGDAIRFVLASGPQTTKAIEAEVSRLLPLLCDDTEILYIRGERYGKAWKRTLRHAQQHLKRTNVIERDAATELWALRSPVESLR